jgi:hypothetical protein
MSRGFAASGISDSELREGAELSVAALDPRHLELERSLLLV